MTASAPGRRRPSREQLIAAAGVVLTALGLRTAVAVVSPIADRIAEDISFGSIGLGVVGMLPPVAFAVFALITPAIVHRLGLERAMVAALVAMILGHGIRAVAPEFTVFVLGSAVVLIGTGVGNVLVPPLVRRYFPTRVGIFTSLVTTLMSIGTAVPSILAEPIATSAGWRLALGMWASIGIVALGPWIALAIRERRAPAVDALVEPNASMLSGMFRSRTAWGISVLFMTTSLAVYAFFAWLPQILAERTSLDAFQSGALLSLYALAGVPVSIVVPILASRMRDIRPLVWVASACFLTGYGGLLLLPDALTWLWVLLAGLGPLLFPLALTLVGLRSRTRAGSVALSGFVQGVGYTVGSLGPLLVGVLHQLTGGYTASLVMLLILSLPSLVAAHALRVPRDVEDEIAAARG
ncbi:MAG: MFS transporter [Naasia sp.]